MNDLAPKSTGCLFLNDDIPRIIASISAYCAQFGCGAGIAVISLTLPSLVNKYHILTSSIGLLFFIYPGIGLILGLLISYHIRQTISIKLSKILLSCCSIFIAGLLQIIIMFITNLNMILFFHLLQFTAFGCVEGFSTIALFEMWGQRIQVRRFIIIFFISFFLFNTTTTTATISIPLALDIFKNLCLCLWWLNSFVILS